MWGGSSESDEEMREYEPPVFIAEGEPHDLLEPKLPDFSDLTVRRAFIMWVRYGHHMQLTEACKLYHYIEKYEKTLTPSKRAESQKFELDLYKQSFATSPFTDYIIPPLYSKYFDESLETRTDEEDKRILAKYEQRQKATALKQFDYANKTIKNHCITNRISHFAFMHEFGEFAKKIHLPTNIFHILHYIKRKAMNKEIVLLREISENTIPDQKDISESTIIDKEDISENTILDKEDISENTNPDQEDICDKENDQGTDESDGPLDMDEQPLDGKIVEELDYILAN